MFVRRLLKEQGKETNGTPNNFMREFGTIGSTERTAVRVGRFAVFLVLPGRVQTL